jgi:hypothetical protein
LTPALLFDDDTRLLIHRGQTINTPLHTGERNNGELPPEEERRVKKKKHTECESVDADRVDESHRIDNSGRKRPASNAQLKANMVEEAKPRV